MGVCQAPEKKTKLNITLSAKNEEFEKKLVENYNKIWLIKELKWNIHQLMSIEIYYI